MLRRQVRIGELVGRCAEAVPAIHVGALTEEADVSMVPGHGLADDSFEPLVGVPEHLLVLAPLLSPGEAG